MSASGLTAREIEELFEALDAELAKRGVRGQLHVVGGAVMCLVFRARPATKDVDALFVPKKIVREAAARVARDRGIDERWLNDAVKGFLSPRGDFRRYFEREHLQVFVPHPEYLLAMKCLAMRLGPEFQDEADVRYLLRHLDVEDYETAREIITRYYPEERFPPKTLYALREILEGP